MKDFKNSIFSGALGKTKNPGGARFMTVPLTRDISDFAYEIDYTSAALSSYTEKKSPVYLEKDLHAIVRFRNIDPLHIL